MLFHVVGFGTNLPIVIFNPCGSCRSVFSDKRGRSLGMLEFQTVLKVRIDEPHLAGISQQRLLTGLERVPE